MESAVTRTEDRDEMQEVSLPIADQNAEEILEYSRFEHNIDCSLEDVQDLQEEEAMPPIDAQDHLERVFKAETAHQQR